MYEQTLRPILFALSIGDAERAHILAVRAIKTMQRVPPLLKMVAWLCQPREQSAITFRHLTFPNPVGLAAGMDKQGELLPFMEALGFGFVEVGTVLPRPQPGSPKVRMFRLPGERALINRMGFNSVGADGVRENLLAMRDRYSIPIGISFSRNKDSDPDAESTAEACVQTMRRIGEFASYITVCVSSPNTPGLRDLQRSAASRTIIRHIVDEECRLAKEQDRPESPVLIKLTCDLDPRDVDEVCEACLQEGAAGLVASNTTFDRPFTTKTVAHADEFGGLSGPPLHKRAVEMVRQIRAIDSKALVCGVGGIDSYDAAMRMRDAGADIVQLLTGLVYHGPRVVREANRAFIS